MSTPSPAASRSDDAESDDPARDGSSEGLDVADDSEFPTKRRRWGRNRAASKPKQKTSLLKELPILLIVAFGLAVLIKTFLFQAFFIPSGSMEPTLHGCAGCAGDRVLVNKIVYYFGDPQPGDIVVFEGPDTWAPEVQLEPPTNWVSSALSTLGRAIGVGPPSEKDYVKRVVAVGGQTVECCDAQGRVLVDGEPLDEPYITMPKPLETRSFPAVTVPEGRLWVMGDNRAGSADSSFHISDKYSGTVAVDDVIGKAGLIVWPFSRFTILDDPDIQGLDAALGSSASGSPPGWAPAALASGLAVPLVRRQPGQRHPPHPRQRHPPHPRQRCRARLRGRHPLRRC